MSKTICQHGIPLPVECGCCARDTEIERLRREVVRLTTDLARLQCWPELPWAEVTATLMQVATRISRGGGRDFALEMRDALDKGKTYVSRLIAERDQARADLAEARRVVEAAKAWKNWLDAQAFRSFAAAELGEHIDAILRGEGPKR